MTKRTFVALSVALVSSSVAAADWQEYSATDQDIRYLDVESASQRGDRFRVWTKREYRLIKDRVASTVYLEEVDCNERRSRWLSMTDYDGAGKVLRSLDNDPMAANWNFLPPGSSGEALYKVMCSL